MSNLIKVNPQESLDQMSQTYIQNLDLLLDLSSYVLILILFGILYKIKEGKNKPSRAMEKERRSQWEEDRKKVKNKKERWKEKMKGRSNR